MTQHGVAIVVDAAFGQQLQVLASRIHVWVIDTPINRPVAQRLWAESGNRVSLKCGVTTFTGLASGTPAEQACAILAAIEEHHGEERHDPPCLRIEVFGAQCDPVVQTGFEAYGYRHVVSTPAGFIASKI
jgi:hypothetical protein